VLGTLTDSGKIERRDETCIICGKPAAPALLGRAY
jgi:hypothetical protein